MTLGEFAGAVGSNYFVEIDLRRETKNICVCRNRSPVIDVYADCKVLSWWIMGDSRSVCVVIDDSELMKRIARDASDIKPDGGNARKVR